MAFYQNQLQSYILNGAGAVIGDTTLVLKTMKDIDGNALTMATSFGAIGYGTIEPGNNTLEEQISFTGLTNNANGTTTLTGVKSVTFGEPYTETSGLLKTHAGSTTFVISNTSGYYTQFPVKQNDETVTGSWSFPTPLANSNPATKLYVDSLVSGGTVTTNALTVTGTAGENLTAGQVVYFKVADGRWYKATSATSATTDLLQLGIVQSTTTTGNPIVSGVMLRGIDTHQTGLVLGTIYYLSTGGGIASSAGTVERAVGNATSTTALLFDPDYFYMPTALQKGALVGSNGTPSASNPFVTQSGLTGVAKFGGTGADGALGISSGTTTIDLGSAAVVTKNYTSIAITATGKLAFSNPHANGTTVILKSQGGVTITSSATCIDASGLGGAAGAAVSGTNTTGNVGTAGASPFGPVPAGTAATSAATGTAGAGFNSGLNMAQTIASKGIPMWTGSGGGSGATGGSGGTGANAGRGGGALYIECGGAWNFTTASGISVAGVVGGNGTGTDAGGSGGGAGGSFVALYATLTANSGTVVVTGASGGSGTGGGKGGAGGSNYLTGSSGSGNGGGAGAVGLSLVAANNDFS